MTSLLTDKRFWLAAVERAVLTTAQALAAELAVFSTMDIKEKGLDGLPWYAMVSVAVVAGLCSLLTSVGKGGNGSAGYKVVLGGNPEPEPENSPDAEPALFSASEVPIVDEGEVEPPAKPGKGNAPKKNR